MTLPTFLGIGAQRSGTTWLDALLRSHAEVYMPQKRKELHYFDEHYSRGQSWYESCFPTDQQREKFGAIGEITPRYLYDSEAPARIHATIPSCRLIAIFRDPVDRVYSQYSYQVATRNERRSFQQFIEEEPDAIGRSMYGKQLRRYLQYFSVDDLLFLIFEEDVGQREIAASKIANFLDIDANGFSTQTDLETNRSFAPRFPALYQLIRKSSRIARRYDLDKVVDLIKATNVQNAFKSDRPLAKVSSEQRTELMRFFRDDIDEFEGYIGRRMSIWTQS